MATERKASRQRTATHPPTWQANALRLMLGVGAYGSGISRSIATKVGDAELVGNLPILVISDIFINGPRRPVEVQRLTGLTSGGVTKLLDRLETHGIIVRAFRQEPADRRAILLDLTPDGVRVANLMAEGFLDHIHSTRGLLRRLADEADAMAAAAGHAQGGSRPVVS